LSWNVYTTNQLTIAQAVTTAQVQAVYEQIASATRTSAPRADLLVLEATMNSNISRFESWLNRLSDRLNEVESALEKADKTKG